MESGTVADSLLVKNERGDESMVNSSRLLNDCEECFEGRFSKKITEKRFEELHTKRV